MKLYVQCTELKERRRAKRSSVTPWKTPRRELRRDRSCSRFSGHEAVGAQTFTLTADLLNFITWNDFFGIVWLIFLFSFYIVLNLMFFMISLCSSYLNFISNSLNFYVIIFSLCADMKYVLFILMIEYSSSILEKTFNIFLIQIHKMNTEENENIFVVIINWFLQKIFLNQPDCSRQKSTAYSQQE